MHYICKYSKHKLITFIIIKESEECGLIYFDVKRLAGKNYGRSKKIFRSRRKG